MVFQDNLSNPSGLISSSLYKLGLWVVQVRNLSCTSWQTSLYKPTIISLGLLYNHCPSLVLDNTGSVLKIKVLLIIPFTI